MSMNEVETTIQDNIVIYKRHFDVPIELAVDVWSSPEHLAHWWGPDGFTLTTKQMDFAKGGFWVFVMHGPDGTDYGNRVQFTEIRKPFFISYKHMGDGGETADVAFEASILFEASGEGANLTFEQIFRSKAELEHMNAKYGAIEGAIQHIGNFAKYLESLHHA